MAEAGHRAVRQQRRRHPGAVAGNPRRARRAQPAGHLSALGGDNRIVTADFDNQGGGLYASGLLSLDGQRFLNQGAAAGQGGKVGAGRIDFSLAGALANRFGQLESESELHARRRDRQQRRQPARPGRSGSTRLVAGG